MYGNTLRPLLVFIWQHQCQGKSGHEVRNRRLSATLVCSSLVEERVNTSSMIRLGYEITADYSRR